MKTENNIKCGEILRCGPGEFIFSCVYCSQTFNSKTQALIHIENHFFVNTSCETAVAATAGLNLKNEEFNSQSNDRIVHIEIDLIPPNQLPADNACKEVLIPKTENQMASALNYFERIEARQMEIVNYTEEPIKDCIEEYIFSETFAKIKPIRQRASIYKGWIKTYHRQMVECDICGSQIKKSSIVHHLASHVNLKKHICIICGRRYNTKHQLKKHVVTHSNFKKYSCQYCGWQFHERTNLLRHIRKHTGEKPYKCDICSKSFSQSNSVIIHMRTHTGEKPFTCNLCGRSFNAKNMLQRHLQRHNKIKNFKCNVCDRAFFRKGSLKDHCRMHTGERPFTCKICNSTFTRRSAYAQHVILHTGQKPYKCRFCNLTFAQGAGRRSHERSVHKDMQRDMSL